MQMSFCKNCNGNRGFKRSLGVGTIFMILLTGGFGLLALPFYPKRCITCGSEMEESGKEASADDLRVALKFVLYFIGGFALLIIAVKYQSLGAFIVIGMMIFLVWRWQRNKNRMQ